MRAHSTLGPKLGISLKKVWPLPHAMREPRGKRVRAREKESRREKKRKKRLFKTSKKAQKDGYATVLNTKVTIRN